VLHFTKGGHPVVEGSYHVLHFMMETTVPWSRYWENNLNLKVWWFCSDFYKVNTNDAASMPRLHKSTLLDSIW